MNINSFLVFLHVVGAIGYSVGTLLSMFGLIALRRVQRIDQARVILGLMEMPGLFSGVSILFVVATGLYLTITFWGWQNGWIDVTLGSLVVLVIPTGAVMGTRRRAIARLANEMSDGPLTEALEQKIRDSVLGTSTILLNALLIGIIFLMVIKSGIVTSIIVIGVSAVLGFVISLFTRREARPRRL